jgi:integrase
MADQRLRKRGQKNGKDVWTAIVPLSRSANGKRQQHRFTFVGTKKDAEKAFVATIAAVQTGVFITPDRATFGDYLADWLISAKTQVAGKTWERYEQIVRVHVIPKLGNVQLQNVTASQLSKAYARWRLAGLTGQTVLHHHRVIHRVLAQALREGRVRQNVAALATRPKAVRKEMRVLNVDEIALLASEVSGTPLSHSWRSHSRPARTAASSSASNGTTSTCGAGR